MTYDLIKKHIRRHRILFVLIASACLVTGITWFTARQAHDNLMQESRQQLESAAFDLESFLQKFESLPFALSHLQEAIHVLQHPSDQAARQRLNLILESVCSQADVSAIYVMDQQGNTLSASNWNKPGGLNFVGSNYQHRPYFKEAIQGQPGRFYGVGNTSGEPGYFITQPIYANRLSDNRSSPIGVITVKLSLSEFETSWLNQQATINLVDDSNIIFLTNHQEWRYHSLVRISQARQQELQTTRQYGNSPITLVPGKQSHKNSISLPVGPLGWRLVSFIPEHHVIKSAALAALTSTLVILMTIVSVWAFHQRKHRLRERILSRTALQRAARNLDLKIKQRTQELQTANENLQLRYTKLQDTEKILRSTQDELVQAGKLAMLGQMAAGMTHELNQPLTAIRAFAENANTFLTQGKADRASENLTHIINASTRMGTIISQLKGFARKSHNQLAQLDVKELIRASVFLLQVDIDRYHVCLAMPIGEGTTITGDAVRVEQVLINLLRNALDAVRDMPEGRRCITIHLRRDGNDAIITIHDSGAGIAEEDIAHIFEPFFTTKPQGEGLGLGLAISSSIVQAMNGRLSVHNHASGGAEFILCLPVSQATRIQGDKTNAGDNNRPADTIL